MGLSITLSNALSGMKVGQKSLDVLSHNVANAGTPGYHKRSLSVIDNLGASSLYAREGTLVRAFNSSLQQHHTRAISESGFASVQATFLDRVQTLFGKPGTVGSIDSAFNEFQTALTSASASPDNFATRAEAVQKAQLLAGTLNRLTGDIQSLRQEIEAKLATSVDDLNNRLVSLERINTRLADQGIDANSRATLLDQRDRLIDSISEHLDIRVSYRQDDTVALMTRSGVGLLDGRASTFSFESAGALTASSQFSRNEAENRVGRLLLTTPAGLTIDLVKQNVLTSGELAGLVKMRDEALVNAQDQLDEIAARLALSMSTEVRHGDGVDLGVTKGLELDIGDIQDGNEFSFTYLQGGISRTVRVVRVDNAAMRPMDYADANGARVLGLDFSGGTLSIAAQLQDRLGGGLSFSNPNGDVLRVLDDGATGQTDVMSLSSRVTATGVQDGGFALSLFTDFNNVPFTDGTEGQGQRRGFAGRISVNSALINDNRLLVQYTAGGSLGDASRINQLAENLDGMRFAGGLGSLGQSASFRLSGTISDFINQTINHQGNAAAAALSDKETQTLTLEALGRRLESEYGVDVDEEMARLMELQNAYAANARVMSVAQELIDNLMQIVR